MDTSNSIVPYTIRHINRTDYTLVDHWLRNWYQESGAMHKRDLDLQSQSPVSLRRSRAVPNNYREANQSSRRFLLVLFLFCLCPSFASAQVSATLSGIVTDQSGATVPAASATARNLDTGLSRDTVTDQAGRYQLFALPLGQYEVRVKKRWICGSSPNGNSAGGRAGCES